MAQTATDDAPASDREGNDLKDRKRARAIVNEALLGVTTPLANRGVVHRLLPGLWQVAVNVALSCYEPEDVLALLKDRSRGIVGEGANADAPPRTIPASEMPPYVAEVQLAAQTIMESIDEALERLREEGLEDRFPETVFDASLQVLIPAWGPHHARRALSEQSALLIRGMASPCNFMEPTRLQSAPAKGKAQAATEAPRAVAEPSKPVPLPSPPQREKVARTVNAYAATDLSPSGTAAWAVVMVSHDDEGRTETREISGTMVDPNGRAASIRAMRECVLAACESSSRATLVVETPSEQCVRAASDGGAPGSRLPGEEAAWDEIDRAASIHRIEFRVARRALDRELSERCDRLLRKHLEG